MYVAPSKTNPGAIRKANWLAAQDKANKAAAAAVLASVKK